MPQKPEPFVDAAQGVNAARVV